MRAGAYGGNACRTYSALGDATNMAARLMMAAGGGILVDDSVHEEAQLEFEFETLAPIMVKGKTEPLAVYRPLSSRSAAYLRRLLDELPPLQQTALRTASILETPFDAGWPAAITGDGAARDQMPALLAGLAGAGLLVEEDGRFRFADPMLRGTVYETMLFAQRRQLHRAAAEWLEATYAADMGPYYADLAHHWERADDTARTIRYLELAAVQARENGDLDAALAFFNRTLELK
jgi:hypothetical protein